LGTITEDFARIAHVLKESAYQIRARGFSQYPIFPISRESIAVGQILLGRAQSQFEWDYYVSFLEEFVQKGLVEDIDYFTLHYKNAEEYCCLFVVDTPNQFTGFVYLPYPEEEGISY
jgi:hypothetical protein